VNFLALAYLIILRGEDALSERLKNGPISSTSAHTSARTSTSTSTPPQPKWLSTLPLENTPHRTAFEQNVPIRFEHSSLPCRGAPSSYLKCFSRVCM